VTEEAKRLLARNTDAIIQQSVTGERLADALERLEARLAVGGDSAATVPLWSIALMVVCVTLGGLLGGFVGAGRHGQQRRAEVVATRPR
jgi:hypothetical protein